MRLSTYVKTPAERKRYAIDYSEWLDTAETLTDVNFSVTPATTTPFSVDAFVLDTDFKSVIFFVSGGENTKQYTVDVRATTSGGQIKEDTIIYTVRDAS